MNRNLPFFFSAFFASVLGFLLYGALISINQYGFKISLAICSSLLGMIAGIFIVLQLQKRHSALYFSSKFNLWRLLFIHLNLFFGCFFGFLVGILTAWLLMYPYVLLFGHPEANPWTPAVSYGFIGIATLSTIVSLILVSRWFFRSAVYHLERKAGLKKDDNPT
jgi:hypothetical protein